MPFKCLQSAHRAENTIGIRTNFWPDRYHHGPLWRLAGHACLGWQHRDKRCPPLAAVQHVSLAAPEVKLLRPRFEIGQRLVERRPFSNHRHLSTIQSKHQYVPICPSHLLLASEVRVDRVVIQAAQGAVILGLRRGLCDNTRGT
jgi:hypothetical protein